MTYPVVGRDALRNRRIAVHEMGHALCGRALGSIIHSVSIIPCTDGPDAFQGRTVRSGAPSALTFVDDPVLEMAEVLSLCERLERLTPVIGSDRVESSEYYIRAQTNIVESVGAEAAELIFYPELPSLGAVHDIDQALAFARIAVAAQPAVEALVIYCVAEAAAIIKSNLDVATALVDKLVEVGKLNSEQVDEIIEITVGIRAAATERVRRADWRRRERNAATFQMELPDDEIDGHFAQGALIS